MDLLCQNIINLLIEKYFGFEDSLALFCTSKKFLDYRRSYCQLLLDAKKGVFVCTIDGRLDALKFIYQRKYGINGISSTNIRSCFKLSYGYGHLDTARWLFQLSTKTKPQINIHDDDDNAFRYCCQVGYLDIARWLIQLGIETHSPINPDIVKHYGL